MATYISLLRYTQQGIMDAKNGPARLAAAKEGFRRPGAEMKAFYLMMGAHAARAILEGPDHVAGPAAPASGGSIPPATAAPGRAFFDCASGAWRAGTEIRGGFPSGGSSNELSVHHVDVLHARSGAAARDGGAARGSNRRKLG